MRSIDIHAHLTPQCFIHAMQAFVTLPERRDALVRKA